MYDFMTPSHTLDSQAKFRIDAQQVMNRSVEFVNYNANLCEPTRVSVSRMGWLGGSRNQYPSISFSLKLQGCVGGVEQDVRRYKSG
jgi:hypothetical protein